MRSIITISYEVKKSLERTITKGGQKAGIIKTFPENYKIYLNFLEFAVKLM